jgi:lipid II:glycine glycyltransferase (peptidoglycan interpeptide bridge formation enzyme)
MDDAGQCVGLCIGRIARSKVWPFSRYCGYGMLLCLPATRQGQAGSERAFMVALADALRRDGVCSLQVYSHDSPNSQEVLGSLGYGLSERYEFYLDLGPDLDQIAAGFAGERRTDIRKAEKRGVQTRLENSSKGLELVYGFFGQSMRRRQIQGYDALAETEVAVRQEQLREGRGHVLVSYLAGEPVNAALFGLFNRRAYYLASGSAEAGLRCCGPAHLIWTAIKMYKEQGAVCLNLGAALKSQPGVHRFKRDFGATMVPQPIGTKAIALVGSTLRRVKRLVRR